MQKPFPANVVGVEVTLDAINPDGSLINIGTVTSDSSGMFKKMWTPPEEGEYTIIATFMGSESYWASYAQTAIGVGPPPSPGNGIEPEASPGPAITTEVAIIITIAVIAAIVAVAYLVLRRR